MHTPVSTKQFTNISNVPTDNASVVDSCLLILHDWSSAINLADKEIDKERGVIREEWRSRNSGMLRIMTNALPRHVSGFQICRLYANRKPRCNQQFPLSGHP